MIQENRIFRFPKNIKRPVPKAQVLFLNRCNFIFVDTKLLILKIKINHYQTTKK